MLPRRTKITFGFLLVVVLVLQVEKAVAAPESNSWTLVSPDKQCAISVALGDDGELSYRVSRAGKIVIEKSPLGLIRDDQDFEHALTFEVIGRDVWGTGRTPPEKVSPLWWPTSFKLEPLS